MVLIESPINEGRDLTMDPSADLVDRFKLVATPLSDCTMQARYRSITNLEIINKRFTQRVWQRWDKIKELGSNNSNEIWLEMEDDGYERAVKRLPKWTYQWNEFEYRREIAASAVLSRHKQYFVPFYGWFEGPEDVYLAMEYFHLGDLEQYMDRQLSIIQIKLIIRQLLEGLCIMHREGFTHRDLKPQNILVEKDNPYIWVKIGDFGITKRVPQDGTSLRTAIGSSGYMAPEVLGYHDEESSKYTNAVDLWSLGCICHRLLTMQPPFANPTKMMQYCYGDTKLPIEALRRDNDEDVAFVKMLLVVNPSERCTAEKALQSTWFDSLPSQETLHEAQCQSQSQDEMPCGIEASNNKWTVAHVVAIVIAIVIACVIAIDLGWCTHSQLFQTGIIGFFASIPMWASCKECKQFHTRSGVPTQYLVILPEPNVLKPWGIVSVGCFLFLCLLWFKGNERCWEPWDLLSEAQKRDIRALIFRRRNTQE